MLIIVFRWWDNYSSGTALLCATNSRTYMCSYHSWCEMTIMSVRLLTMAWI